MTENRQVDDNVEIHVGPQVNFGDNVVSVEMNEEISYKTNLICNCSKVHEIFFILLILIFDKILEVLPIKLLTRSGFRNLAGLSHQELLLLLWQGCYGRRIFNFEIISHRSSGHLCSGSSW